MKHHYPDCQGGPSCDCDDRENEEEDHCDVAGTIYGTTIVVEPVCSNVVLVRTKEYE